MPVSLRDAFHKAIKIISIIKPRAPKQEIVEEINDNVDDELIEA